MDFLGTEDRFFFFFFFTREPPFLRITMFCIRVETTVILLFKRLKVKGKRPLYGTCKRPLGPLYIILLYLRVEYCPKCQKLFQMKKLKFHDIKIQHTLRLNLWNSQDRELFSISTYVLILYNCPLYLITCLLLQDILSWNLIFWRPSLFPV